MRLFIICMLVFATPVLANNRVRIDVVKVTDGDTVKAIYNGEKINIRLSYIDCYETRDNKRAYWQAEHYHKNLGDVINLGNQSKEILRQLIDRNHDNIYMIAKGKDKYKRTLGELFIGENGESINEYMLQNGKCEKYETRKKINNH